MGCAATHHISSYVLVAVLGLTGLLTLARRESRKIKLYSGLALAGVGGAAAWLAAVAPGAVNYLSPHIEGGLSQTIGLLTHPTGARKLFEGSTLPVYERAAAFVAPVLAAAGACFGLLSLRRRGRNPPVLIAIAVLGLAYFPALPFFLSRAAEEGARRSLDFSYLGIAVLGAPAVATLITRTHGKRKLIVAPISLAIACAGAALLMGNVASGFNEFYRFPGPYAYGSDTRSQTPELRAAVAWFRSTQGTNQPIIVDRYNGLLFASRGLQWTATASKAFPLWDLYLDPGPVPRTLLQQLRLGGWRYLVVDERMERATPRIVGYYLDPNEPLAGSRTQPVPRAALNRYLRLPWTRDIYSSSTLKIYRIDVNASTAH